MKTNKDNRAVSSTLILSGLWFINILIVVFGSPFLLIGKIKELCAGKNDKFQSREQKNRASYLPCGINSKF